MLVQEKTQDKHGILASQFVQSLAQAEHDVPFGMSVTKTLWAQQAFVYASGDSGIARQRAFQNLLLGRPKSCVLISGKLNEAKRLYPMAAELAHGKLSRIFNTGEGRWNYEKSVVFAHYKYVIVVNPEEEDPLAELAVSMGSEFSLLRDNTHFIINHTGW